MELGEIVNIKAPGGRYWKGKITEITYALKHTYNDSSEATLTYCEPTIEVHEVNGPGHAFLTSVDIKKQGKEWFERDRGEGRKGRVLYQSR